MLKLFVTVSKSQVRQGPVFSLKKNYGTKRSSSNRKKVAVVLSGCGHLDGTCIHEASAVAVHLTSYGIQPVFYAPACPHDVINHQTECPGKECRGSLEESARIARGTVENITELRHCDVSGVIFPGGFGVTKTLSSFEQDGINCSINSEVMRVMEEFQDAKKPMGFLCIAAILPARMFPLVKITLGMKGSVKKWPHQKVIECATAMGAEVEFREVDMFSFDKQHMVFSTPAFMYAGSFSEIFNGIGIMTQKLCGYLE